MQKVQQKKQPFKTAWNEKYTIERKKKHNFENHD